ncbi:hypothetical protein G6F37_008374 [Rhizopus arrhizus]|nr:hypothetical protein G6F38_010160 [Rhizopus arrhizus]KAG1155625.1 hypothetical protein G6F37_008374 [Rhizopus arrhizus]
MGNQFSSKIKLQEKANKSFSSQQIDSSSNASTFSSNQPKLPIEYLYPSNEAEANRQTGQHYLFKHLFQGNFFAPVDAILNQPGSKTLDVGCGSQASWLTDMAMDFPHCEFHGFDIAELSFDEIERLHLPKNLILKRADLFDGFDYEANTFDFVHQRVMYNVYPQDKIPWMFQEILRITKPNGWIEFVEPDIKPKRAGPLFMTFIDAVHQLFKSRLGKYMQGRHLVNLMVEAGFRDVKSDYGSLPCCWGGYIGKLMYENLLVIFRHLGPSIYSSVGLEGDFDERRYEALLDKAFDECVEYQTFINFRWTIGRKVVVSTV